MGILLAISETGNVSPAGADCVSANQAKAAQDSNSGSGSIVYPQTEFYRISLVPPNYSDPESVKRHLIYSRIWGVVLKNQLASAAHGSCATVILPMIFPELFVSFFPFDQTAEQCRRELPILLRSDPPSPAAIMNASRSIREELERMPSIGIEFQANYIFQRALREIYENGSVVHALMSVDADAYAAIDPTAFLNWLSQQNGSNRATVTSISVCEEESALNGKTYGKLEDIPYSPVVRPGVIKLPLNRGAMRDELDRLLLLPVSTQRGIGGGALDPESFTVGQFCDKRQKFSVGGRPENYKDLRIVCLHQAPFGNPWVVFFCDPKDCTSPGDAAAALASIQSSIETRDIATSTSTSDHGSTETYLVEVQSIRN